MYFPREGRKGGSRSLSASRLPATGREGAVFSRKGRQRGLKKKEKSLSRCDLGTASLALCSHEKRVGNGPPPTKGGALKKGKEKSRDRGL